jgi:hypothetical protein
MERHLSKDILMARASSIKGENWKTKGVQKLEEISSPIQHIFEQIEHCEHKLRPQKTRKFF